MRVRELATGLPESHETLGLRLWAALRLLDLGWRADPLKGHTKFHGGIDLAARYGTEVPAAAGGTVVVAESQGGYGLTVVLRHADVLLREERRVAGVDYFQIPSARRTATSWPT